MRYLALFFAVPLALVACSGDSGNSSLLPTDASRIDAAALMSGPTDSVDVQCASNLVDGERGLCAAFGYDSAGAHTNDNASWGTSTPSLIIVPDTAIAVHVRASHMAQGTAVVQATIDGILGEYEITINLSTLEASIIGDAEIPPNTACSWLASISAGTTPYDISWHRTGSIDTSTQSEFITQSASNFTIYLEVIDDKATQRFASLPVTVDSGAPPCPSF